MTYDGPGVTVETDSAGRVIAVDGQGYTPPPTPPTEQTMNQITPTIGRIVYYRGSDGNIRPAIITGVNGPFNVDLYVFPIDSSDVRFGLMLKMTHADPEKEPGCLNSWHWMPDQIQQAERAEKQEDVKIEGNLLVPGYVGAAPHPNVTLRADALMLAMQIYEHSGDHTLVLDAADAFHAYLVDGTLPVKAAGE